jgi:predicted DCC family thiol-disulfide oxidoreductase YuxK
VIFFDGECHLCHGFVRFVLRTDTEGRFDFAALGEGAQSVVLQENGKRYEAEEAVLRILPRLRWPWPWVGAMLGWLPRRLLAWVYRWVARHRYALFGRGGQCELPRPEWKKRLLP